MAKLEIKQPKNIKSPRTSDLEVLIDGKNLNDILTKVLSLNLDMQAPEKPLLTITCHVDEVEIDSDVDIDINKKVRE